MLNQNVIDLIKSEMRCEHFKFISYTIEDNIAKLCFNDNIEFNFDLFNTLVIESKLVMKENGKVLATTYIRDFTYLELIIALIHRGLKLYHRSTVSEIDY